MQILESEDLNCIGSKDLPSGQKYAFKLFARRGHWFSWRPIIHTQFLFYFNHDAKLAKIGKVPLIN